VSTLGDDIARVVAAVVEICDAHGLIGREMCAIDGVTLPSNASKHRSGTRADFARHATTLEAATALMVERHRSTDALPSEPDLAAKAGQRIARLERDATELRRWLAAHPADRRGPKSTLRKSKRTDNDSARMATGKGVIQGYTGVAAVDARHQIIVEAQAHGTGSEEELLGSVVDALRAVPGLLTATSVITADAGYHSEANLKQLASLPGDALIADPGMRGRDARFTTQHRYHARPEGLHTKAGPAPPREATVYQPHDVPWRPVVAQIADKFLACGVLEHGFARIRYDDCAHEYLLAFSCKARYFCPSCHAKRLVIWTQWLDTTLLAR